MNTNPKRGSKAKKTSKPTFTGFVKWLEAQDPAETYRWSDPCGCAIARYLRTLGYESTNDISFTVYNSLEGGPSNIAMSAPHTFGAALNRARIHAAKR